MKAKLPKTVKIGHLVYTLEKVKETLYYRNQEAWGMHTSNKLLIQVAKDVPSPSHEAEVVLHECMHGLFDHFEIQQLENMTPQREEFLVSTLARGIIQLLSDNPKLTKYIAESVNG